MMGRCAGSARRAGMSATARVALLAWLLTACDTVRSPVAPTAPTISGQAQVAVEVWSGFTQRPGAPVAANERIEILLDATTSMRATAPGSPARFVGARQGALRLLEGLPADARVRLWGLGGLEGEGACTAIEPLSRGDAGSPAEASTLLEAVRSESEGSLAGALDEIRGRLAVDAEGSRVVVFSDLGAECGGDLCRAASALVDAGARLDVVILSDALLPQCFARFTPGGGPRAERLSRAAEPAVFRVDAHQTRTGATGPVLGRGRTGKEPIRVAAGAVTIRLRMEPESTIGPLVLSPGTLTRVRVLDFPTLDPPVREWRWDVVSLGSSEPAPAGAAEAGDRSKGSAGAAR